MRDVFDKQTSEIKSIDCVARFALSTPVKRFEPNGIPPLIMALSGGLLPTSTAAVEYAAALFHTSSKWAALAPSDLAASESDSVWHVRRRGEQTDLMTLSKRHGRVLSGTL